MKVAVSGPNNTLCHALLAALHDARWDIARIDQPRQNGAGGTSPAPASTPNPALDGADVLYILDLHAANAGPHTMDRIKWLVGVAPEHGTRRIVVLNPSVLTDAARAAETVLAQTANCEWVVIRAPHLYDPNDPETLAPLKRIMIDGIGAAGRMPFGRLHPLDLCAALIAAARSTAAVGRILDVADPVTLSPEVLTAELQRLGRLFSDAGASDDRVRPAYPTEAILDTVIPAFQTLGLMPARRAWTGLAECAHAIVGELRREGRVADNTPRMSLLQMTLESGSKPLTGKVCLVTGATAGIGRALAVILSRCGAHVIATGRNKAAGAALMAELSARPCCEPGSFHAANLCSMAEIDGLLGAVADAHPRVDVLVNTAGAVFAQRQMTVDGIEASFAVNHLAPFLITTRLHDRMPGDGHIINLCCDIYLTSGLDFSDLFCARNYAPLDAYARAKFANMMFTATLMRRADGTGPTICAVNPGDTRTDLLQGRDLRKRPEVAALQRRRNQMGSSDRAAGFIAAVLLDPDFAGHPAIHIHQDKITEILPAAADPVAGARLWQVSDTMVRPGWRAGT